MKKIIFGMIFLASTAVFAGNVGDRAGNGGDAVVCDGGKTAYLLDYVEANLRGMKVDLGDENESVRALVERQFQVISKFDPERVSNRFQEWARDILADLETLNINSSAPTKTVRMISDVLNDIDDSKEVALPVGCEKRQLVVFLGLVSGPTEWRSPFPEDPFYYIHLPTWKVMSNGQKAMTIMHELWYRELIQDNEAEDSRGARYINSKMYTNDVKNLQIYVQALGYAKVPYIVSKGENYSIGIATEYCGNPIDSVPSFDQNGRFKSGLMAKSHLNDNYHNTFVEGSVTVWGEQKLYVNANLNIPRNNTIYSYGGNVFFNEGKLYYAHLRGYLKTADGFEIKAWMDVDACPAVGSCPSPSWHFMETGEIKVTATYLGQRLEMCTVGQWGSCKSVTELVLGKDRKVNSFTPKP